jgi:hypothetical protein
LYTINDIIKNVYLYYRSRNSSVGIVTGYVLDCLGSFPGGDETFCLFHSVHAGSGAHSVSYPMGTGDSFPGDKAAGHEADHSPPSSVEFKNGGAMPPLPHTSSWHSAWSIKHRDNFTFLFFFLYGAAAHIGPWPPLYEVP